MEDNKAIKQCNSKGKGKSNMFFAVNEDDQIVSINLVDGENQD